MTKRYTSIAVLGLDETVVLQLTKNEHFGANCL